MPSLSQVDSFLKQLFDLASFEGKDVCPNGLQVEGSRDIKKMACAVSASLESIEQAIDWGADALLVHHGIMWKGKYPLLTGPMREKVGRLLDAGVSLFAYHLPMDAHQELGNNWGAARDLSWSELETFGSFNGMSIGVKGRVSSLPIEVLVQELEDYYGVEAKVAKGSGSVQSLGLISGGAHWSLEEAIAEGLDAFITGSYDEPIWNMAKESGVHFIALGHSASERIGPKKMAKYLQESLKLETRFIEDDNPF